MLLYKTINYYYHIEYNNINILTINYYLDCHKSIYYLFSVKVCYSVYTYRHMDSLTSKPSILYYNKANITYLDSCFRQAGFGGQSFTGAHAWIMTLVEFLFQFVQLIRAERRPVTSEFRLFGPTSAAHAFHIVFAAIHATDSIA